MNKIPDATKEAVLQDIAQRISSEEFACWFKTIDFIEAAPGVIEIPLPHRYYQDWYEKHYRKPVHEALSKILGNVSEVSFKYRSNGQGTLFSQSEPSIPAKDALPQPAGSVSEPKPNTSAGVLITGQETKGGLTHILNPKYTFDRFIVGECNRLAHAAALAVAEKPGKAYQPLFIYGSVGLGKTHLLQAICHLTLERHHQLTVFYLSCENFVNDYIHAVKTNSYESFRSRYRSVDLLIIDDIHFLGVGTKTGSQEEFFHTFNALHNAQKQIILSSDSAPNDIPILEERLVSRFRWGMVASLTPPILETRIAILKNKVELLDISIPEDVIFFIASNIDTNIRDLEGALVKVAGYAGLTQKPFTMDLAKEALQDLIKFRKFPMTITDIQEVVSKYFNITPSILQSKKRLKSISIPRQISIYLARTLTPLTLEEIGAAFGGKDHTTVMYAIEKTKQRLHKDAQFKATIDLLTNSLKTVNK